MYSLTPAELLAVVKTIVEEVRGQVPVISGTGFNRQMAIELAQQSAQAGVDGILALPPYYPNADHEGLADYYAAIGAATPLGLFDRTFRTDGRGSPYVIRQQIRDTCPPADMRQV